MFCRLISRCSLCAYTGSMLSGGQIIWFRCAPTEITFFPSLYDFELSLIFSVSEEELSKLVSKIKIKACDLSQRPFFLSNFCTSGLQPIKDCEESIIPTWSSFCKRWCLWKLGTSSETTKLLWQDKIDPQI